MSQQKVSVLNELTAQKKKNTIALAAQTESGNRVRWKGDLKGCLEDAKRKKLILGGKLK